MNTFSGYIFKKKLFRFIPPSSLVSNYTLEIILTISHLTIKWATIYVLNGKLLKHQGIQKSKGFILSVLESGTGMCELDYGTGISSKFWLEGR